MAYNGQRGPNVAEFIANLNAIPSAQELASQETFNLDDDLAMFTNTQFFDFDLGQDADLQPTNFGFDGQSRAAPVAAQAENKNMDFIQGDFTFPEFAPFSATNGFTPDNAAPAHQHGRPVYPASSSAGSPTSGMTTPHTGDKRKVDSLTDSQYNGNYDDSYEGGSRIAAEEDKRRRNTAASARFRVKKKQREQALEKSAKEMSDKVAAFELRISQLETENKWLKNLVMEKNENKDDIAALWKKYSQDASERKGDTRKDGVGTGRD